MGARLVQDSSLQNSVGMGICLGFHDVIACPWTFLVFSLAVFIVMSNVNCKCCWGTSSNLEGNKGICWDYDA